MQLCKSSEQVTKFRKYWLGDNQGIREHRVWGKLSPPQQNQRLVRTLGTGGRSLRAVDMACSFPRGQDA